MPSGDQVVNIDINEGREPSKCSSNVRGDGLGFDDREGITWKEVRWVTGKILYEHRCVCWTQWIVGED